MEGRKDTSGLGPPEVVIDRSDEQAEQELKLLGPIDPATATQQEIAERIKHLETLLGVHE